MNPKDRKTLQIPDAIGQTLSFFNWYKYLEMLRVTVVSLKNVLT